MTTKLCRDCRHSAYQCALTFWNSSTPTRPMAHQEAVRALGDYMACRHDAAGTQNLVTGRMEYRTCNAMRYGLAPICGADGRLWEVPDAQDS